MPRVSRRLAATVIKPIRSGAVTAASGSLATLYPEQPEIVSAAGLIQA
jgi:hypothetical protein